MKTCIYVLFSIQSCCFYELHPQIRTPRDQSRRLALSELCRKMFEFLTLADIGGNTPWGFSGIFFYRSNVTIFHSFPTIFFTNLLKISRTWPLTFDLWRHNWGHVRRKMRSVAHNLQTSPFLLVIWMQTCIHVYICIYVCIHVTWCYSTNCGTHAFHRSSGPSKSTDVNWGINDLCRLFEFHCLLR